MSLITKIGILFTSQNRANSGINSYNRSISRMGKQLLAVAGVGGGIYAVKRGLESVVKAAATQQRAEKDLQAATQGSISMFKKYAAEMQTLTVYGDEQILSQMAYAKNLGVTTDQLEAASTAAIGLAAKYRIDLASAMMLVGRASSGQTQMLTRYGIVIDQNLSTQDKFNELLRIGTDSFHLAKAQAKDATGQYGQFKNAMGDIAETIGTPLLGALTDLTKEMVKNKTEWQTFIETKIQGLKDWASAAQNAADIVKSATPDMRRELITRQGDAMMGKRGRPGFGDIPVTTNDLEISPQAYQKLERMNAYARREKQISQGLNQFMGASFTETVSAKLQTQPTAEEKKAILEKAAAQRAMFRDMKRMTISNHSFRVSVIKDLKDKYIDAGIARVNVDLWYVEQAKKLDIERLRSGSSMYGGLRGAAMQMQLEITSLGEISYQAAMTFQKGFGDAFADVVMRIKTVDDAFKALFMSVARGALNTVGQNIAGAVLGTIFSPPAASAAKTPVFTSPHGGAAIGTGHNGIPAGYFPRLHGGLAADEFPAIIQKGEEIIPKSRAGGRGGSGALTIVLNYEGVPMQIDRSEQEIIDQEKIVTLWAKDVGAGGMAKHVIQEVVANVE